MWKVTTVAKSRKHKNVSVGALSRAGQLRGADSASEE
jgi:hypothetical protein